MKIANRNIGSFLNKVDDGITAVLIYGPDAGLVRERADRLTAAVAGDASDPFRVSDIVTPERLRDQPSLLMDEAAALTFGGSRRVVRLRTAGDGQSGAIAAFLKSEPGGLLVAEGDELGPRSALRQLFEAADNAAALPCYRDEGADLARFVTDELRREGLQLADETRDFLAGALGGDRAVTRREIEKIVAYMGPAGGTVGLADAVACVGDNAALSVDDLVFAVGDGDLAAVDRLTDRVLQEGTAAVAVLRAAARHFLRLHLVSAANGDSERMIRTLKPPVFYKYQSRMQEQTRRWSPARLHQALSRLTRAEMDCKSTGMPADVLCRRSLLEVAALLHKGSRGRTS
ncbi:MAG: DNA polymerase III subunit delta [Dongiaceae bacterium]